jgi:hypothetical protein
MVSYAVCATLSPLLMFEGTKQPQLNEIPLLKSLCHSRNGVIHLSTVIPQYPLSNFPTSHF